MVTSHLTEPPLDAGWVGKIACRHCYFENFLNVFYCLIDRVFRRVHRSDFDYSFLYWRERMNISRYIMMNHCNELSLNKFMRTRTDRREQIDINLVKQLCRDLAQALKFLHEVLLLRSLYINYLSNFTIELLSENEIAFKLVSKNWNVSCFR